MSADHYLWLANPVVSITERLISVGQGAGVSMGYVNHYRSLQTRAVSTKIASPVDALTRFAHLPAWMIWRVVKVIPKSTRIIFPKGLGFRSISRYDPPRSGCFLRTIVIGHEVGESTRFSSPI